ncbi:hypothetical protein BZG13_05565 [Salinivibrio sp. ML323]|uniref:DUF6602 domain-containing protein n=1 Tax=Salinivibrio sp. ML323 TaxID=1909474 RepID=UPI000985DCB1|nr:DUF6602 domain-containing protein [Salinivibrio sp. ML323]OOE58933.1 hypothetical protein BZG13_05565 [Salinivibrio sp. ML323]
MKDDVVDLQSIFQSVSKQIKLDYDELAEHIPHFGERGEGREQVVIKLLREYLPERFGVNSGFIVDVDGNVSQQTDIIIYDRFVAPKFKVTSSKYLYPCESVVAAGEVKSFLDKNQLLDSLRKLKRVRALDRTGRGKNRVRMGYHYRMNEEGLSPEKHNCDAIWTFVFCSDSPALKVVTENFIEELSQEAKHLWPNMICVLNKGIISYHSDSGLITDPRKAVGVYHSLESESEYALLKWFMLLCGDICDNHISAIDMVNYLKSPRTENRRYPIHT